jgi:hypothetical protein
VDTPSKKSENRIGKMAIGGRIELRIVYLLVQGNYKGPGVVRHTPDPLFMQIIQEFSIKQGVIFT